MVTINDGFEIAMVVAFFFTSARIFQQVIHCDFPTSESFFVEINLHKKKWLINCSYNPNKNNIDSHLNVITKTFDTYYGKYENVVFLGDFNAGIKEATKKSFCESYNLTL